MVHCFTWVVHFAAAIAEALHPVASGNVTRASTRSNGPGPEVTDTFFMLRNRLLRWGVSTPTVDAKGAIAITEITAKYVEIRAIPPHRRGRDSYASGRIESAA